MVFMFCILRVCSMIASPRSCTRPSRRLLECVAVDPRTSWLRGHAKTSPITLDKVITSRAIGKHKSRLLLAVPRRVTSTRSSIVGWTMVPSTPVATRSPTVSVEASCTRALAPTVRRCGQGVARILSIVRCEAQQPSREPEMCVAAQAARACRHGRVYACTHAGMQVPASMNMTKELYTYVLQHTREPEVRFLRCPAMIEHFLHGRVLKDLRKETAAMLGSHMQITPDQGQMLGMLVQLIGATRAVEVGVFTGYSSVAVAMALPKQGTLFALDKDDRSMTVARKYWKKAGVSGKVVEMLGPAQESLKKMLKEEGPNSIDIAFIGKILVTSPVLHREHT
eukprot:361616-Chlamydomonas_euryale.AAC.24